MTPLFLLHLACTMLMLGVIWVIQVVHYPLFKYVGNAEFHEYHKNHMRLITFIVAPVMDTELMTGLLLLVKGYFAGTLLILFSISVFVLLLIWLSTALLQAPRHKLLVSGFNEGILTSLVNTNWIRTVGWTIRSSLLVFIAYENSRVLS